MLRVRVLQVLFFLILLGLLGAVDAKVFRRGSLERRQLRADIARKQQAILDLSLSAKGFDDVIRRVSLQQQTMPLLVPSLPRQQAVSRLLVQLNQMASANGLTVRSARAGTPQSQTDFVRQSIDLTISGDFNHFYAFLVSMEQLPAVARLTRLTLDQNPSRDGAMTAQLSLSLYFKPDWAD